ncbi:MAG: FtsX-like permease family protein [Acidobacteria bacterium]|nr:MAG: FtsX-like permease family protein [Acidobacteriota bacterium]
MGSDPDEALICALMRAFVGLFGVVAYSISRRTREMAVRRAFGATERRCDDDVH